MKLFDSHSHLHDSKFHGEQEDVLARAYREGVTAVLTLGDTLAASREAIALSEKFPNVLAAVGIHPSAAPSWDQQAELELRLLLRHPRVVVLGEIGLDYYWDKNPAIHLRQRDVFRAQLAIARELHLPVSVHSRLSNEHVLQDIRQEKAGESGGVLHCFQGNWEQAFQAIELGFMIGVGGIYTYPNSVELREVIRRVGIDHILLETDAPYLPPQTCRGKRNEPAYLRLTASNLAEQLGLSLETVAARTYDNTCRCFRLKGEFLPYKEPDPAPVLEEEEESP